MKKTIAMLAALLVTLTVLPCACADGIIRAGDLTRPGQAETSWNETHADAYADHTGLQIVYFDNLASMLLALNAGKIDEMYAAEPVAQYLCARKEELTCVPGRTTIHMSMAVRAGDEALCGALNDALAKLQSEGTMDELYAQYTANTQDDPVPVALPKLEDAQTLRVVVTGDLPPLDYVSAEGTPAGFNIAFLGALGEALGMNIELITADAGSRTAMLESDRADAIFWMRTHETVADGVSEPAVSEAGEGVLLTDAYLSLPLYRVSLK